MTQPTWQKLSLILIILSGVWPAFPTKVDNTYAEPVGRTAYTAIETVEHSRKTPCLSLFQSGCKPEIVLIIRQFANSHALHWDRSQWGLPVYIEFDAAKGWQRVSVLCLHLTRKEP